MRKLAIGLVLVLILSLLFISPVMAAVEYDEWGTRWVIPEEIDPADAFDKDKLTRTFILNGVEYEDLAFVFSQSNIFKLDWFSEHLTNEKRENYKHEYWPPAWGEQKINEEIFKSLEREKERFIEKAIPLMYEYPRWDVISINGEPWQNTKYRDNVIEGVDRKLNPGEILSNHHEEVWAVFMDPRTNGAAGIWFGDPDNPNHKWPPFAAFDDWQIDKITKYNPLNNGKPFDFNSWTWEGQNAVITEKEITEVFPDRELKHGAILVLGSRQVVIFNDGASKTNSLSVVPEIIAGRTLIPLRGVLDELGYELSYNGEKNEVEIKGHGQVVLLILDGDTALVDGREVKLDQPAILKDGRTMIPFRFLAENLGFTVDYDNGKITLKK